ncbi:MAG: hypothetical protein HPY66_0311 [Firmicutes bacterium]|nr:hypothetical protein [Bacillota bacterium]MDI6704732.1 uracil-DNA glycosylase family protein [Bacillota bacterium]
MDTLIKIIERCERCREREKGEKPLHGEGNVNARVVFVCETPPEYAYLTKSMLTGPGGKVLRELINLSSLDIDDIYITALLKCTLSVPGERVHFNISRCFPYLVSQLRRIKPMVICPLGGTVLRIMTGDRLSLKEHRGKPVSINDAIYFPLLHPAQAYYDFNTRHRMEMDMISLGKLYRSLISNKVNSNNIFTLKVNNNR